jgi:pimeloyl-ACP methyl ester carboxylesterase
MNVPKFEQELLARQPESDFMRPPTSQEMGRRSFLRLLGVGAVAAGVTLGADTAVGDLIWGGTNPEIGVLDNAEAKRLFPDTYTLVMSGFSIADVKGLAESVNPALRMFGQVGYIKNGNSGLQIEDMKRETVSFARAVGAKTIRFYGHSMSGMEAAELGAHLQSNGVDVDALYLDCTPKSYLDVRGDKQTGTDVLTLMDNMKIHGGPLLRFLVETGMRVFTDHRDDYLQICREALGQIAPDSCSNTLIEDQARYIRQFDADQFAGAFKPTTGIIKLQPEDLSRDTTIDNALALPAWRDTFSRLEPRRYHDEVSGVIRASVPNGSHADPNLCPDYIPTMIAASYAVGLSDGHRPRQLAHAI